MIAGVSGQVLADGDLEPEECVIKIASLLRYSSYYLCTFLLSCSSSGSGSNRPVGDWISAPSPNVVDPQTMTHRMTDSVTHR